MGGIVRLNRAQRVVLLVALGVIAAVVTTALTHEWDESTDGGWFAYAPNTGVAFSGSSSSWPIWRDAIAWVVAALLWCGAGLFLLRTGGASDPTPGPPLDEE
jgi:hypothetical protein